MPGPFAQGFWEEYQRMMKNTMDSAQKLVQNMNTYMGSYPDGANINMNMPMQNWNGSIEPEIRINNDNVVISIVLDRLVTKENTQVYLEGYYIVVNGAMQAKIPLPTAVQKYGGTAIVKDGTLEIKLLRDKYSSRQIIPVETA